MAWSIIISTLSSNIWKLLIFYEKESYFVLYFENMKFFYKSYDYNFKRINFKLKKKGTKIYNIRVKSWFSHSHKNQNILLCGQKI
jgi:hypothetical protein